MVYYVEPLCSRGSKTAFGILSKEINEIESYPVGRQKEIVGSLISYYSRYDIEAQGITDLSNFFSKLEQRSLPNKGKAFFYNQLQRLFFGTGELDKAIEFGIKATDLDFQEEGYFHNLSLCYEKKGDLENSAKFFEKCLVIQETNGKYNDDHLVQGIRLYRAKKDNNRVEFLLTLLKEVNPHKYRLVAKTK